MTRGQPARLYSNRALARQQVRWQRMISTADDTMIDHASRPSLVVEAAPGATQARIAPDTDWVEHRLQRGSKRCRGCGRTIWNGDRCLAKRHAGYEQFRHPACPDTDTATPVGPWTPNHERAQARYAATSQQPQPKRKRKRR